MIYFLKNTEGVYRFVKKYIRPICICLILVLSCSLLAGCNKKPEETTDYAIKVGDHLISESEYARTAKILRQDYLNTLGQEETEELWASEIDTDLTLSQAVIEATRNQLIWLYLYQYEFDRLGLTLSESETKAIAADLEATIASVGTLSEFHTILETQGYTYEEYEAELYAHAKKAKVLDYYFGAEGVQKRTSDQDIKDWYNVNYSFLKAIYFWREDTSGNALSESEQQEMKSKAEDAYASATQESEQDLFGEIMSNSHDSKNGTVTAGEMLLSKDTDDEKLLIETAMNMELGEVELLELEEAYAVIKRYDGCGEDRFTEDLRLDTLEDIRADLIEELLEQWETEIGVSINEKIISKYAPEKLMSEEE